MHSEQVDPYKLAPIDPGAPDDGETFTLPLASCMICRHFLIAFLHPTPPTEDTRISALIRDDDICRIRCAEGRIRYANGDVKEYNSRQLLRTPPTRTADCPGFEEADEIDLFDDVKTVIDFVLD
jgi:hypothetical protein